MFQQQMQQFSNPGQTLNFMTPVNGTNGTSGGGGNGTGKNDID